MAIRILVVDDHSVVRQGIITLLEDEDDIEIVGEASDGDEVAAAIETFKPTVVLLDLTMPRMSGLDVIREVAPNFPKVSMLVFSMHDNPDYIIAAGLHGAAGYLQKDTSRDEMIRAIRSIHKGNLYFPPYASSLIIRDLLKQVRRFPAQEAVQEKAPQNSLWNVLSPREQQILECLIQGLSSKDIAEKFDISANTVANQRASIMKKTSVKNTAELISLAMKGR